MATIIEKAFNATRANKDFNGSLSEFTQKIESVLKDLMAKGDMRTIKQIGPIFLDCTSCNQEIRFKSSVIFFMTYMGLDTEIDKYLKIVGQNDQKLKLLCRKMLRDFTTKEIDKNILDSMKKFISDLNDNGGEYGYVRDPELAIKELVERREKAAREARKMAKKLQRGGRVKTTSSGSSGSGGGSGGSGGSSDVTLTDIGLGLLLFGGVALLGKKVYDSYTGTESSIVSDGFIGDFGVGGGIW
jgi:uncharacterized membrane protein YgcG